MDFKQMINADISRVFLDLSVFAEKHRVAGEEIPAVLDEDALKDRQGGQELGIAEASMLLFAAVSDLPPRRPAGETLNVDGREYIIADWREDMGVATISLAQSITM